MTRPELQVEINKIIDGGQNTAVTVRDSLSKIADESYNIEEAFNVTTNFFNVSCKFFKKGNTVILQGFFENITNEIQSSTLVFELPSAYLPKEKEVVSVGISNSNNARQVVIFNDDQSLNALLRRKLMFVGTIASSDYIAFNLTYSI